eukprot:7715979-Pyramimonas_sp.AAC.2
MRVRIVRVVSAPFGLASGEEGRGRAPPFQRPDLQCGTLIKNPANSMANHRAILRPFASKLCS